MNSNSFWIKAKPNKIKKIKDEKLALKLGIQTNDD
jgi:hypothetical protein